MFPIHELRRCRPYARLILGAAFVAAIMGCSDEPIDPGGGGPDPTLEEIVLTPATVTLQAGATQQYNAVGRMSDGSFAGVSVSYSATGGTITSAGLYTAGSAAGDFHVVATQQGGTLDDTAAVTITAPPPSGIALAVQRLAGGSGVVLVSNGIPLAPGALQAGDVGNVQVWVEGQEQAVYVEALEGRHPDGSVRSILVQFQYDLPDMTPKSGQLGLGTARTTTDLSKTTPPSEPLAVALPSSPDYLVTTLLAGALLTEANSTITPDIQAQSDDYDPAGEAQWTQFGDVALRGGAQYEHPHTAYSQWFRSGDVTWWDRATRMATSYRDDAMNDPWNGNAYNEWHGNSEGVALHYSMTGAELSRTRVGNMADFMLAASSFDPYELGGLRLKARELMSTIDAYEVNSPFIGRWDGVGRIEAAVDAAIAAQLPSGQVAGTNFANSGQSAQKQFMVGMLWTAMIRYYDGIDQDVRIPVWLKQSLDWTWENTWHVTDKAFMYVSQFISSDDNDNPEPCLSGMMLPGYAWFYRYSGDATYRDRYDAILEGLRNSPAETCPNNWSLSPLWAVKQFDQAFYRVFNSFTYRQ
jgi:hypothetical protein